MSNWQEPFGDHNQKTLRWCHTDSPGASVDECSNVSGGKSQTRDGLRWSWKLGGQTSPGRRHSKRAIISFLNEPFYVSKIPSSQSGEGKLGVANGQAYGVSCAQRDETPLPLMLLSRSDRSGAGQMGID
jgi:hypothetical protein